MSNRPIQVSPYMERGLDYCLYKNYFPLWALDLYAHVPAT